MNRWFIALLCLCLPWWVNAAAPAKRALLDIADGQDAGQPAGWLRTGVVGLSGTGDKSQVKFTGQSMANMLKQFGVQLPDDIDPKLKNVAAVSVQANLPALAGKGQMVM